MSKRRTTEIATLFRHMVFNAAIGNVDDHLKNFWMLATSSGYKLAPAFDLVPDISGRMEHTLSFQYGFACPTGEQLLAVASDWNVSRAREILHQVIDAVSRFAVTARRPGFSSAAQAFRHRPSPPESTRPGSLEIQRSEP